MAADSMCRCQNISSCAHSIAGSVYKTPDFEMTSLKVDKYTHSAVPSAGLVFTF